MSDTKISTLMVTDAELIRRLGVPEKVARPRLRYLDDKRPRGWPLKDSFWGDRRSWPDVEAFVRSRGNIR